MGKKLYVGNLSYSATNADLEGLFAPFGSVRSVEVIEDRDTGRSKGFAFVEMSSDQEAAAAIAGLSGKEHDGRALTVNEARPREERSGGGGGGGRGRGGYGGGGGGGGGGRGGRRRRTLLIQRRHRRCLAKPGFMACSRMRSACLALRAAHRTGPARLFTAALEA